MITVLAADDDRTNLHLIKIFCRDRKDLRLEFATNGQEALDLIQSEAVDILLTDVRMPLLSGDALLSEVKKERPEIPVVIMTGYGSIEGAVDYLQRGADDYLTKPLAKEVFIHRLERVIEQVRLSKEIERLRSAQQSPLDRLIGQSPQMVELKRQLPTIAQTEASVVIYGDSGTGKEVIARCLHELSKRSDRPFVTVNCGALPENLLESELFGYRRGAFTDAHQDTPGLVEAANSGTLFLDEIGEISLQVQVKLLRFLELKEYKPVGSPKNELADVRIVAATNRDLREAVEDKSFREDLYYRLNVIPVEVPPLKERAQDIPLLTSAFLERFNAQAGKNIKLSPEAFNALYRYEWPGNIRELENKIEQLVVMSTADRVDPAALRLEGKIERGQETRDEVGAFREEKATMLRRFEREYVATILRLEGGHVTRAARRAGLDRKNLWQLMKRHNIDADTFKEGPPVASR